MTEQQFAAETKRIKTARAAKEAKEIDAIIAESQDVDEYAAHRAKMKKMMSM